MQNNYVMIERKLKNQEYNSIYELFEELKGFQNFCLENSPPGPNRRQILAEFCLKGLGEAAEFFLKNISNELYLQRQIAEETVKKLEMQLKEQKDESRARLDQLESKNRVLEIERAEISAKEQSLKENLAQVHKEKEQIEIEMTDRLNNMKRDAARQLDEAKNKI